MPIELPKHSAKITAYLKGLTALLSLEESAFNKVALGQVIPPEWEELENDRDPAWQKKVKVTMWVDEGVAKYFKSLGPGYTTKMNWALRAYVQFRMAKVLSTPREARFWEQAEAARSVQKAGRAKPDDGWGRLLDRLKEAGIDPAKLDALGSNKGSNVRQLSPDRIPNEGGKGDEDP